MLRVSAGEMDRALADVQHFGTRDDELLVRGEIAIRSSLDGPESVRDQLLRIGVLFTECSPEIQELVAVRIAEIDPEFGLRLAMQIPEPGLMTDCSSGSENPAKGRCMFKIFRLVAKRDLKRAAALAKRMPDSFHKAYANVSVGAALLPEQPSEAFQFFRRALSCIRDNKYKGGLPVVLARYALWQLPKMDLDHSVAVLRGVAELVPMCPDRPEFVAAVDQKINEQPGLWLKTSEILETGRMKDFIRWRLGVLGLIPLGDVATFEDPRIRDAVRAIKITEMSSTRPLEAAHMAEELETLAGYARAIAGIAKQIEGSNQKMAERLIEHTFESESLERDWDGFDAALELLRITICWPGALRRKILTWCLNLAAEIKPEFTRADAYLAMDRVLAESLLAAMPHEAGYFSSLVLELDTEAGRSAVALGTLRNLSEDVCERIAQQRVAFGLLSESRPSEPDKEMFLPETQVRLLTCLADRLISRNRQLASQLLQEAANLAASLEDEEDRDAAGSKIVRCAMKFAPSFVWQVYPRCGCGPFRLFWESRRILRQYAETDGDVTERFLRVALEWLMTPGDYKKDREYRIYINKRRLVFEETLFPPLGYLHSNNHSAAGKWVEDLPNFFSQYVENFKPDHHRLSDIHELAGIVAQIDWNIFMAITRDPQVGPLATRRVAIGDIRRGIFKSQADVSQLLDDIAVVSKAQGDDVRIRDPSDDFRFAIIAAAAACDPETCIDLVASTAEDSRCDFAYKLKEFTPKKNWTEEQLSKLFDILEACKNKEETCIAEAHMLEWLGQHFVTVQSLVRRVTQVSASLSEPWPIVEVAKCVREVDKSAGKFLIQTALDRALTSRNAHHIVDVLKEGSFLAPKVHLDALAIAREADAKTKDHYWLGRIAELQAILDPEETVRTLSLMKPNDSDMEEALEALSKGVKVKTENDIEYWMSRLSRLPNLDKEKRNYFARSIIRCGLKTGVIRSTQTFRYISDIDDRVDAYVTLSESLDESAKASILARACQENRNGSCRFSHRARESTPCACWLLRKLGQNKSY